MRTQYISMESLEVRRLLSAVLRDNGNLLLMGDADSPNTFTVAMNAAGSTINITINTEAPQSFAAADVQRLRILGGNGGNTISIDEAAHAFSAPTRIFAGDGADSITAGSENDFIMAGGGNDTVNAGDGINAVIGGPGDDDITTGAGNDRIFSGIGNDTVTAGDGNNLVIGGAGDDSLTTGAGDDTAVGGGGTDLIDAGAGTNVVFQDFPDSTITRPAHPRPVPPTITDFGTIQGAVTDGSGAAVEGAKVILHTAPDHNAGEHFQFAASFAAATDSQGQYTLSDIPVGNYVIVAAKHDTGEAHAALTVTKDATTTQDMTLQTPVVPPPPSQHVGVVTGTVKDATDQPVEGASVLLVSNNLQNTGRLRFPGRVLHATTDADGAFSLDQVPAGDYTVMAGKFGVGFVKSTITVQENQTATADLVLQQAPPVTHDVGTITGLVQDGSSQPVANAVVTLGPVDPPPGMMIPTRLLHVLTDDQGNFTLTGVPVGDYRVKASKPGVGMAEDTVTITKDQSSSVTLTLAQPTPTIDVGGVSGTVTDGSGHVVIGAQVVLVPAQPPHALFPPPPLRATTDDSGVFTFDNIRIGDYNLMVFKRGIGSARATVTIIQDQTATADVVLTMQPPPHA